MSNKETYRQTPASRPQRAAPSSAARLVPATKTNSGLKKTRKTQRAVHHYDVDPCYAPLVILLLLLTGLGEKIYLFIMWWLLLLGAVLASNSTTSSSSSTTPSYSVPPHLRFFFFFRFFVPLFCSRWFQTSQAADTALQHPHAAGRSGVFSR
jgi:hypothetical protein